MPDEHAFVARDLDTLGAIRGARASGAPMRVRGQRPGPPRIGLDPPGAGHRVPEERHRSALEVLGIVTA